MFSLNKNNFHWQIDINILPPNPARVADAAVSPVIARPEAAVVPVAAVDPPRVIKGNANPEPIVPAERNVEYTAGT